MADNHTKEVRSRNMSHIRSKNTKPEEKVRKYLFSKGFRYRINVRTLPGCPDIVLPKYKTVIFGTNMTVQDLFGPLPMRITGFQRFREMWKGMK